LELSNVFNGMDKGSITLKNITKNTEIKLSCDFTDRQKSILKAGGLLKFVGQGNL
jgi:aconitate hydratase